MTRLIPNLDGNSQNWFKPFCECNYYKKVATSLTLIILVGDCSLISFVQPRGLKLGLRSSSKYSLYLYIYIYMYIFTLVPFCVCEFLLTIQCFRWEGLESFLSKDRTALYCDNERSTKGFSSSYKNLHFYWILGAGHFVSQLSTP